MGFNSGFKGLTALTKEEYCFKKEVAVPNGRLSWKGEVATFAEKSVLD